MYGIPIKFILMGAGVLFFLAAVGLHVRKDNQMREQIISLQVDLRTSENNYITCENINRNNAEAVRKQQASIEQFALEKQTAIEKAALIAQQLTAERRDNVKRSAQLRQKVQQALQNSNCAVTAIPPDALILLNNAIGQASAG